MNIQELLELDDWTVILDELKREHVKDRDYTKIQKNLDYYNNKHTILEDSERADETVTNEDGSSTVIKRSREIYPYPRQIVTTKKGMLAGEPCDLILKTNTDDEKAKEAFQVFQDVWRDYIKLDAHNLELIESVSVESKACEIFFDSKGDNDPKDIKVRLCSLENGDKVYIFTNDSDTVEAITREFKSRMIIKGKIEEVEVTEVYTAGTTYILHDSKPFEEIPNKFEKISAVFYDQKYAEFEWVKDIIDKVEKVLSQWSDVNKRVGNTSLVVTGEPTSMPKVGDMNVFKVSDAVTGADGSIIKGDVKLLESQGASDNIMKEVKIKEDSIYKNTYPDLSKLFDEAATGNISTATMKMKFIPALIKVAEAQVVFGAGMKRRINVLKNMLFKMTNEAIWQEIDIEVKFNSILPDDLKEYIEILGEAVNNGTTSQENVVYLNPLNRGKEDIVMSEIKSAEEGQLGL